MHKEHVTPIDPASLNDKELIRFADEFVKTNILGMTTPFQREVLERFEKLIDRIANGDLVEPDNSNEELESEISALEDENYDLQREVDRLNDELDALKEQSNQ